MIAEATSHRRASRLPAWLFLGLLMVGSSARATCDKDGISLFPAPGGVLPTNTHFILEGVGEEQPRVAGLVGKRLVLKAPDDEVLLRIQRGWQSAKGRVAVHLTPSRALKPGRTYTLELERLLPRARLLDPAPDTEQASWRIGKEADTTPPEWTQPPVPAEGRYARHEKEVTRWITVHAALNEVSPAYLVVTLRKRGAAVQTYFAPVNGDVAQLGHDPCSGNFLLENRASYRATVEAFDAAGNSAGQVPPVDLASPTPVRP